MSASARQQKHEEERPCVAGISFSFHFINFRYLVADIDIVCGQYGACCGRYSLWPISLFPLGMEGMANPKTHTPPHVLPH